MTLTVPTCSYKDLCQCLGARMPNSHHHPNTLETSLQMGMGSPRGDSCLPKVPSVPASGLRTGNMRHWKGTATFWKLRS